MTLFKHLMIIGVVHVLFFLPLLAKSAPRSSVIIFVSFSMPEESLKMWMRDAKWIKAPVMIRGLLDNSFKETTLKLSRLVKNQAGGMQVDPLAFKAFYIEKVPAVVVTDGTCSTHSTCEGHYDVIYGDVTLAYALEKIAEQKTEREPMARSALANLSKEVKHD